MCGVWVEEEPVEVGVQGHELLVGGALDLDDIELVIPEVLGAGTDGVEGVVFGDLQCQVLPSLVERDQRGRDP